MKRARRNPATASKAVFARMRAFASEIGGIYESSRDDMGFNAEVIWPPDARIPISLRYSVGGKSFKFSIEYSDDDVNYKYHQFRSLDDAELTFRRLIQRRQPDPGYAKRRIIELSKEERSVLPNPARLDIRVIEEMKQLALQTLSSFSSRRYGADVHRGRLLTLSYWSDTNRIFVFVRVRGNERQYKFTNIYDAVEAYKHFQQRLWPKPGYAEARRKKLSEQEHPALPNPTRSDKNILNQMRGFARSIGGKYTTELLRSTAEVGLVGPGYEMRLQYTSYGYADNRWTTRRYSGWRFYLRGESRTRQILLEEYLDNIDDAIEVFQRMRQRLSPDPGYAERRMKALSEQEHPELPNPSKARENPAQKEKTAIDGLRALAKEVGVSLSEFVDYSFATFKKNAEKRHLEVWYDPSNRFPFSLEIHWFTLPGKPRREGYFNQNYRFSNIHDLREAFWHFYHLMWKTPGYAKERMRELAAQEHPRLPGGRTQ